MSCPARELQKQNVVRVDWHYSHGGGTDVATEWRAAGCGDLNLCCTLGASRIEVAVVPARDALHLLRADIARACVTASDLVAALNRLVEAHGQDDRRKHEPDMVRCEACWQ